MTQLPAGTVHDDLPDDVRKVLLASDAALQAWNSITPLARNEWLCWVEDAKQLATRTRRIQRLQTELAEGKRRPCCWIGCVHRTDKPLSPSVKGILERRKSSR